MAHAGEGILGVVIGLLILATVEVEITPRWRTWVKKRAWKKRTAKRAVQAATSPCTIGLPRGAPR